MGEQLDKDIHILLTEMSGKIDLLNEKMANSHILIEQRIDSNAREQLQLIRLVESQSKNNEKRLNDADSRFANIVKETDDKLEFAALGLKKELDHLEDRIVPLEKARIQTSTILALMVFGMPLLLWALDQWFGK